MSAFVCTKNITFSSIVNLAAKYQEIKNKDLLCQRLYLLNVESVNQRYQLRDSVREENRKEYQSYISNMAGIRYGTSGTARLPAHQGCPLLAISVLRGRLRRRRAFQNGREDHHHCGT